MDIRRERNVTLDLSQIHWNASDDCSSDECVSTVIRKARIIDSNFDDNPGRAGMVAITVTPLHTGI